MLADEGKSVLTLSEDEKEVSLTASEIVERIVAKFPKDEKGRIDFGDQPLALDSQEEPPATPDTQLSEEERTKAMAEELGVPYKSRKDGDA
jgi:hypothetical protein